VVSAVAEVRRRARPVVLWAGCWATVLLLERMPAQELAAAVDLARDRRARRIGVRS